jgi:hypothetical protein
MCPQTLAAGLYFKQDKYTPHRHIIFRSHILAAYSINRSRISSAVVPTRLLGGGRSEFYSCWVINLFLYKAPDSFSGTTTSLYSIGKMAAA